MILAACRARARGRPHQRNQAQADAVITMYRRWFNIGVRDVDDGWIALEGTRPGADRAL
jgi:hypothetical protein